MLKPAYLALSSTLQQNLSLFSRLLIDNAIDDILMHYAANDNRDCFLTIKEADLQPHLDHITDHGNS